MMFRLKRKNDKCEPNFSLFLTSGQLLNAKKWWTCNFSLYHLYIIQQTGNENIQIYLVDVVILIWYQIPVTNWKEMLSSQRGI